MKGFLSILFCCIGFSVPMHIEDEEDSREFVRPEYLDSLLRDGKYEEFDRLMGIDIPELTRPSNENRASHDPRYNPNLPHGDILPPPKKGSEERLSINMDKYRNSKWSGGVVPVSISSVYTQAQRDIIMGAINEINTKCAPCVKIIICTNQADCVFIFSGNGCWSSLGRRGGQQSLSLDTNGCVHHATVIHELCHALGLMHEQCRYDRNDNMWYYKDNVKPEWQSQFEMVNSADYWLLRAYDFYSLMHYPQRHSDFLVAGKTKAFDPKDSRIDVGRIGYGRNMTSLDVEKMKAVYC